MGQGLAEDRLTHPLGVALVQAEPEDLLDLVDAAGQGRLGQAQGGRSAQQAGVLADGFYDAEMAKLEPLIEVTVHPFRLCIQKSRNPGSREGFWGRRKPWADGPDKQIRYSEMRKSDSSPRPPQPPLAARDE